MYTIYICHSDKHRIKELLRKSNLNLYNNILYEPENSDIDSIRNFIGESQFIVVDITDRNITDGINLGIALEKNVKAIVIDNGEPEDTIEDISKTICNKYEIIKYRDYSEVTKKLEQIIMGG